MYSNNVEIKSKGGRHSVYVGGVKMDCLRSVSVEYDFGELAIATIKIVMAGASTKVEEMLPHEVKS